MKNGDATTYVRAHQGDKIAGGKITVAATTADGEPQSYELAAGELERLQKIGHVSDKPAGAPADERTEEGPAKEEQKPEPVDLDTLAGATDEDLSRALTENGVQKLLAAVGDDKELAGRMLAAEQARGTEARSSLVDKLEKLTAEESS